MLVRELLSKAVSPYPPSPDWLASFLMESDWFGIASARVAQKPQSVVTVLRQPKFAPSRRFFGLGVPRIETAGDLARWLNVSIEHLDWLADTRHLHNKTNLSTLQNYTYRLVPKRAGLPRLVERPKPRLKAIQRQILHEILDRIPVHKNAHGFAKKRSCLSAAQIHAGEAVVMTLDLRDFFLRTKVSRVHAAFRNLGYPSGVAFLLTGLCVTRTPRSVFTALAEDRRHDRETQDLFEAPHLPQGAPTSRALSNLTSWRLDCRLSGLARSFEANYTRYADDLAFSGDASFSAKLGAFFSGVNDIVSDEGFALNGKKTRIMRRAQSQRVMGLIVNDHLNVPRKEYDELKAILNNCLLKGPERENRSELPHFYAHLDGRITWVENVNPRRGAKLRSIFQNIKWHNDPGED